MARILIVLPCRSFITIACNISFLNINIVKNTLHFLHSEKKTLSLQGII